MTYLDRESAYFTTINRRRLLDLLGESQRSVGLTIDPETKNTALQYSRKPLHPVRDEIVMIWHEQPETEATDVAFVLPDGERRDFLAWATTYVSTHSPFTRFFRVFEASELETANLWRKPQVIGSSPDILTQFAGTAIAEAVVQTGFRITRPSALSVQSCQLTFSFAVMRALVAGYEPVSVVDLATSWDRARSVSGSRALALSAEQLIPFWLLSTTSLFDATSEPAGWMRAVSRLIRAAREENVGSLLNAELLDYPRISDALARFIDGGDLPREKQLRLLDQFSDKVRDPGIPQPLAEALLGYAIAKLSNGSFEYLGLAADHKNDFPSCALWFSMFAIWQRGFDGLTIASGLGRHLAAATRSYGGRLEAPIADMSVDEFMMLSDHRASSSLRNLFGSTVEIELMPGVSSKFPNPAKRPDEERERPRHAPDILRLTRLLREALIVAEGRSSAAELQATENGDLFEQDSNRSLVRKRTKKKV